MTSTRGLLSALLAAALVLGAGLASAPRPDTPVVSVRAARAPALVSGPVFNDPVAGGAPGRRVVAHLERAIDGAPRGSTIRLATYTFQLRSTADKLAAASRRGVRVHLVVDGHATPPSMLLRAMRRSGVTVTRVRGTARTARNGNMHAKLYLFSRTLGVEDVVMVGSANVATGQIGQLWTDLYTAVSDDRLHDRFTRIHRELARDQPVAHPYQRFTSAQHQGLVFPRPGSGSRSDDLWQVLDGVDPSGAVVRVSVYTWSDARGELLAEKLVELARAGADVAVLHNGVSARVRRILDDGGVRRHDSRLDRDGDGVKDFYVHHKYLLVGEPGSGTWRTWTGSHNWNTGSLRRSDEVLLRIDGRATFDAYLANFEHVRRAR